MRDEICDGERGDCCIEDVLRTSGAMEADGGPSLDRVALRMRSNVCTLFWSKFMQLICQRGLSAMDSSISGHSKWTMTTTLLALGLSAAAIGLPLGSGGILVASSLLSLAELDSSSSFLSSSTSSVSPSSPVFPIVDRAPRVGRHPSKYLLISALSSLLFSIPFFQKHSILVYVQSSPLPFQSLCTS